MLHEFEGGGGTQLLYCPVGLVRLASSRCGYDRASDLSGNIALQRLCAAFETARPRQTAFGKMHAQAILLNAIAKRLRLADYLRRSPDIATAAMPDPVFIVAPFRTGTTFLHRLLAGDPDHRWPRLWEVAYPPPAEPHWRGDARYFNEDARIAEAASAIRLLHRASPALSRLHPMGPNLAEECFGLLETSFLSHSFMFYAELGSYFEWLEAGNCVEWAEAYETYAAQWHLLQWWYPGRRWVLKSPVHLWNLDLLLKNFPRSYVIQLHRNPIEAVGSFCRLLAAYREVMCRASDPAALGEQVRRYIREVLRRAVAARRGAPACRFIDVHFTELVRDPLATINAIYAGIGEELLPGAELAMRTLLRAEPSQRRADTRIETFGLDPDEVGDMFAAYDAFGEGHIQRCL